MNLKSPPNIAVQDSLRQTVKNLNEQVKGIWGDDPQADSKITQFLKTNDIYSNPAYHKDKSLADSLMRLRMDSRGQPINRALIGDKEVYKSVVDRLAE